MHAEHRLLTVAKNDARRTRIGMSWIVVFEVPDSTYIPVPAGVIDPVTTAKTAVNNHYCLQRAAELAWIAADPRNLTAHKPGRFIAAICIGELKELPRQERQYVRDGLRRMLEGQGMRSVRVSMAPCGCLVVDAEQLERTERGALIIDAQPDVLPTR